MSNHREKAAPGARKRELPEPELQIAAAAITAVFSPPLGIAVAAGSALRSPRVREALRKRTVQALAGAIQLGDQLAVAARRAESSEPAAGSPPASPAAPNGKPPTPAASS